MTGLVWGCIGAAIAMIIASLGSCIGVGRAGMMASAILAKDPSKFSNVLILQLLPATQGIYGFIIAFLAINYSTADGFTKEKGLATLFVCLPVAIVGFLSAVFQGKVAMGGMELCVKQEKQMGKAMTMAALVEIFAIFAFVISFLGLSNVAA